MPIIALFLAIFGFVFWSIVRTMSHRNYDKRTSRERQKYVDDIGKASLEYRRKQEELERNRDKRTYPDLENWRKQREQDEKVPDTPEKRQKHWKELMEQAYRDIDEEI